MEMDPNPPSFNIPMNVGPLNLGQSYASGMQAGTQAGEQLGKGISAAFDVMNRNRTADDTLTAMNQAGMLSNNAYQAVAGKSLGAKESMLGMYAGQWIAQQAANREMQKAGYQGNVEVDVAHKKLLDTISAVKSGYGAAVGVQPGKLQVVPQTAPGATAQNAPVLAPLQAGTGVPQLSTSLSGTPGAPAPLGTNVTNPQLVTSPQLAAAQAQKAQQTQLVIGAPIGAKEQIPPGARIGTVRNQQGIMMPDGKTFRPFQ